MRFRSAYWVNRIIGLAEQEGGVLAHPVVLMHNQPADNPATGGYWIVKSDGGVDAFNAPWHGSIRGQIPAGQAVTGIAGA